MKQILLLSFFLLTACTKQSPILQEELPCNYYSDTTDERYSRNEMHGGIFGPTGDTHFADASFVYYLSPDYQINGYDSASIINQAKYVNQVINHGAPKDSINYPYTKFDVPNIHGNIITENPVSIKFANTDTATANHWYKRILTNGYGAPTHYEVDKSHYLELKAIFLNL